MSWNISKLGEEYENFYLNSVKEDSEHTQNEELNKMAKILEDFEPNGLMN